MKYAADVTVSNAPSTLYGSNKSLVDPNNYEDLENSIVDRYVAVMTGHLTT